jgi:hypothetical protein
MKLTITSRMRVADRYSYEHHNINEPAILLGGGFIVDIVEKEEQKVEEVKAVQTASK